MFGRYTPGSLYPGQAEGASLPLVFAATIAGVDRTKNVDLLSWEILDNINEQPNNCRFECFGFTPAVDDAVVLSFVSREFTGKITDVSEVHNKLNQGRTVFLVQGIDNTREGDRYLITKAYGAQSATLIAQDIVDTYMPGFTRVNIQVSLPTVATEFKMQYPSDALAQLARLIGGYFYYDFDSDVHFFLAESTDNPADITSANLATRNFRFGRNTDQVCNRIFVEGIGASVDVAAAIGDTTLRVSDASMFADGDTAVVDNQIITYTGIGFGYETESRWDAQTPAEAISWRAVAWSPTLGLFVAVNSSGAHFMSSPDGVTWTVRTPAEFNSLYDICWSPALGLFAAVSYDGTHRVQTSPDGITWTARTAAEANSWTGICWSEDLTLFVAVAQDGTHRVMTSPDGTTWTARTAASATSWRKVTWASALSKFVAVADSPTTTSIMTSADGTTWASQTLPTSSFLDITYAPELGLLVAIGGRVYTSPTGVTWTERTLPSIKNWNAVEWAPGLNLLVAVSDVTVDGLGNSTSRLMVSADGVTWTLRSAPDEGAWYGLAWAPEIATFVAVGLTGSTIQVMTNVNGIADQLEGIPASGAGSIVNAIAAGAEIHLLVQDDDASSQATYGIREFFVQDRRLSFDGATDRAAAELVVRKDAIIRGTYTTTDRYTRSGKSLVINQFGLSVTATLMRVRIYMRQGDPLPQRDVTFANQIDNITLYTILRKLNRDRVA